MMAKEELQNLLQKADLRATKARMAVLAFLDAQAKPVGIEVIAGAIPEVNEVTLYRMMNDFVAKKIVILEELGHGHADYELATRPHHHHLVCKMCGAVEDVYACGVTCSFEKTMLQASETFSQINQQISAFFGICKKCA